MQTNNIFNAYFGDRIDSSNVNIVDYYYTRDWRNANKEYFIFISGYKMSYAENYFYYNKKNLDQQYWISQHAEPGYVLVGLDLTDEEIKEYLDFEDKLYKHY